MQEAPDLVVTPADQESKPLPNMRRAPKKTSSRRGVRDRMRGTMLGPRLVSTSFVAFEIILLGSIVYLFFAELSVFQIIPTLLVLGWIGLLVGYYGWCTYFYSFNFGRSSQFWDKFVARVEEARAEGKTENEIYKEMAAPRGNPYADQTFGFPPGTVRGSLALTIIVGGLALLLSFLGGEAFYPAEGLVLDYFEFFKTAFLMVVAFYFGTKALDIMEKQRTMREGTTGISEGGGPVPQEIPDAAPSSQEPQFALPQIRPAFAAPLPVDTRIDKAFGEALEKHFPHIKTLEAEEQHRKELNVDDMRKFAEAHDLELAAVRSVVQVESSGSGFLKDGRPKILFEGHVFWRQLEKVGINPERYAATHPSIVYKRWTREHYRPGTGEHERLAEAKKIHETAALSSASWGLFQIMGYHAEPLGYDSVQAFVAAQEESEREHLEAFGRFLDKNNLFAPLRARDWATFARKYNGPAYKQNKYDEKLQAFYERFKGEEETTPVT